jgi:hypothetical protein
MVKKRQKQLDKFSSFFNIDKIINDILSNSLSHYDIIKLSWYSDLYRLRKWKIRIIFKKSLSKTEIINIDTRGDVYKWI